MVKKRAEEQVADVVGHGGAARAITVVGGVVPLDVDASKFSPLQVLRNLVVLVEDAQI